MVKIDLIIKWFYLLRWIYNYRLILILENNLFWRGYLKKLRKEVYYKLILILI